MNFSNPSRTGTALVAGAALFVAVSAGAGAAPATFNVSTTINASCSVTDSGPTDLTPTYSTAGDSGSGSATILSTSCSGSTPTVTFTDSYDSDNNLFVMYDGSSVLYYQISNSTSCSGVPGDNPVSEAAPIALPSGANGFNICAAVIAGGINVNAPAGTYSDTVTYSITP